MKTFDGIMGIGNVDLKGLVIEESPNSFLVTANRIIYVPEKKIILMDQATEQESRLFMKTAMHKGGIII